MRIETVGLMTILWSILLKTNGSIQWGGGEVQEEDQRIKEVAMSQSWRHYLALIQFWRLQLSSI